MVTGMGFTVAQGRHALKLHPNNVEAAINWLLESAGDPIPSEPELMDGKNI